MSNILIVLWFGSEIYHAPVFPINCRIGSSAICKINQSINCTNICYFKTINFFIPFLRAKMVFLNIKWPINHWSNQRISFIHKEVLQDFHLKVYLDWWTRIPFESVQLASQDKIIFYRDFSSRIHSLYNWQFLWTLQEFPQYIPQ